MHNADRPVLVVEESEPYATFVEQLLRMQGHAVVLAAVEDLRAAVEHLRPRLVILGFGSGSALTERVREVRRAAGGRTASILVLAAPGSTGRMPLGANAMLVKPFDAGAFAREVERLHRVSPRHPVRFEAAIKRDVAAGEVPGLCVNLSESGVLMACSHPLALGESVHIVGQVARGDAFLLNARVVRRAGEWGRGYWGLAFEHQPQIVRHAMQAFQLVEAAHP